MTGLEPAAIALYIGPSFIAKRFNSVSTPLPALSADAQCLHQSLTIADFHADSLLWGRDLSTFSADGHVNKSRPQQGNVTLKVFF